MSMHNGTSLNGSHTHKDDLRVPREAYKLPPDTPFMKDEQQLLAYWRDEANHPNDAQELAYLRTYAGRRDVVENADRILRGKHRE